MSIEYIDSMQGQMLFHRPPVNDTTWLRMARQQEELECFDNQPCCIYYINTHHKGFYYGISNNVNKRIQQHRTTHNGYTWPNLELLSIIGPMKRSKAVIVEQQLIDIAKDRGVLLANKT